MRKSSCGCPSSVGPDAPIGEYCDSCHQLVTEVWVEQELTDREKLLEAEQLVRSVIDSQHQRLGGWESAPITGRLGYVADTLLDVCKEVTD